ncbi:ABC transporter permease [Dongia soli]|uniref:ABC transporter permease subunit n=1 Tax=Dongia soli TaxID=600628 RepID=A0ABU5EAS2_9PROT|nr:ABC transporter permease subunit [Dongia soli]MDY0883283.1 ABC transporter permease subunit [Dongia soli]
MAVLDQTAPGSALRWRNWRWPLAWMALLLIAIGLISLPGLAPWAIDYPKQWIIPLAAELTVLMKWVVKNFFIITRAIASILQVPLDLALGLLAKGFTFGNGAGALHLPRMSWLGIIIAFTLLGRMLGGGGIALIAFICFSYIALFGQWDSAMLSLASIAICVPFAVLLGLGFGILAHRSPKLDTYAIRPMLDLMQTVPAFAYLVPVLLLFGFGPVSAMIATIIFAMPPMVRATALALQQVPEDIQDFASMAGCTRGQRLWRVMIPTARPLLMVGVNQVIMMTLNMVIIASMIGAGGLGYDVLLALRSLDIGKALEAGLAIVALAIALDRLSQAAADQGPLDPTAPSRRRRYAMIALAVLFLTTLGGLFWPWLAGLPKDMTLTTGPIWSEMIAWINVNFFDAIDATRTWLLLHLLNPVKQFLLKTPWIVLVAALGLLGLYLGGIRRKQGWHLASLAMLLFAFSAVVGLWEKAMITVYLCGISAAFACLIGIPLGILGGRRALANRILGVVVDTLQTLPSFVYLIPVVMLFRVGDVTAMIAIVFFAVAPAIRYTSHGIRQVPSQLIEAATAMGCTRRQLLWRVQLPLALPEILLGINQTILLALSMLVITALVGTRDLGQEVYIALTKADPGRGIVAGLAIAFIGITADRLMSAWARRLRQGMGLATVEGGAANH